MALAVLSLVAVAFGQPTVVDTELATVGANEAGGTGMRQERRLAVSARQHRVGAAIGPDRFMCDEAAIVEPHGAEPIGWVGATDGADDPVDHLAGMDQRQENGFERGAAAF